MSEYIIIYSADCWEPNNFCTMQEDAFTDLYAAQVNADPEDGAEMILKISKGKVSIACTRDTLETIHEELRQERADEALHRHLEKTYD